MGLASPRPPLGYFGGWRRRAAMFTSMESARPARTILFTAMDDMFAADERADWRRCDLPP